MEKENTELETEGRRLKKKLDALKNMAFQLEALEKENSQLEQENLELRRSAESLRSAGAKVAQLEAENRELESERSQMKRSLELLKASSKKTERLEVRHEGCRSHRCFCDSTAVELKAPQALDFWNSVSPINIFAGKLQGIRHIIASGSRTTSSWMLLISQYGFSSPR